MKKLYAAYLGWRFENNFIEDHEIVFVVASDKDEAKQKAKEKSKIKNDIHCDGLIEIKNVDGYALVLEKEGNEKIVYDNTYSEL